MRLKENGSCCSGAATAVRAAVESFVRFKNYLVEVQSGGDDDHLNIYDVRYLLSRRFAFLNLCAEQCGCSR